MEGSSSILRVYLVFNGPLGMSAGKMAAQAFQVHQRLDRAVQLADERLVLRLIAWERHTTTIARIAKTPTMFQRVRDEIPGVTMIDEGYTEVPSGSPTCWASWPLLLSEVPKLLSNAKIPLL